MNAPYPDLSIDLETLDNGPRSVILSVGAVPFNRDTGVIAEGVEKHISILCQPTRTMSLGTIKWWLSQSKEAKKEIMKGRRRAMPLRWALDEVFDCYASVACDISKVRIWGNGANFDNAILSDAFKNTLRKKDVPWKFWNDRCLRTLADEYERKTGKRLKDQIEFVGERHGALADARHQAKLIIEASRATS